MTVRAVGLAMLVLGIVVWTGDAAALCQAMIRLAAALINSR